MGDTKQNIRERLADKIKLGTMTAADANVALIRAERFRLIVGRVPRDIRTALNAAVKTGVLGHLKKDGLKPEVYYHPTFDYLARDARNKAERESIRVLHKCMVGIKG